MWIKAKRNFTDKETGNLYEKDKTYEVKDDRGKEILKNPYQVAEEVKEKDKKNKNENQDTK